MTRSGPSLPSDHVNQPILPPLDLDGWIRKNAKDLKPPVSNKQLFTGSDDVVLFVSGGPNTRNDYHVNPTEELFYQLKGDIAVRVRPLDGSKPRDVVIKEGELFLLPRWVPHRPQRPAGTVGLIVEFPRPEGQLDGLRWYCPECDHLVHEVNWRLKKIDEDLAIIMNNFWNGPVAERTCLNCGHVIQRAGAIAVQQTRSGVKVVSAGNGQLKATAKKSKPAPAPKRKAKKRSTSRR
jgi:3-hydroxyanthranilate 3,4-dioxygenase